jgi:tetratricopeptide (TPR) repeat protein
MLANVGDGDLEMQMLEGFRLYPAMVDLRFHRWDTLLAAPEPATTRALSHAFWRYARAMALAAQGKARDAAAEQRRFERERAALPPESRYLINNTAADLLALAAATLDAQLAQVRGDGAAAADAWRRAVTLEAALQYDEPPAWFYTVRQSLGATLLRAGNHAEAERVFRDALAMHPRDGRLLYGLWQTLLAQGRGSEALLVEQQFARAWADATAPLTLDDL